MDRLEFKCVPSEVGLQQLVFDNSDIDIIIRGKNKVDVNTYTINIVKNEEVDTHLAPKEREVLVLVAAGMTNDEIAIKLDVQLVTVKKYVSSLLYKIGVTNRVKLSNYYYRYLASYSE